MNFRHHFKALFYQILNDLCIVIIEPLQGHMTRVVS